MPVALDNISFPIHYTQWDTVTVELQSGVTAISVGDVLVPNAAGLFARAATDAVLVTGFMVAIEKFFTGMTHLQCAIPGSIVPALSAGDINPGSMVTITLVANSGHEVVAATVTKYTEGKIYGRAIGHLLQSDDLRDIVATNLIMVRTGVF